MTRYAVATDYDWQRTHKTDRLTVWSGAFASQYEGEAISLPRGDGYMVHLYYGDKVRVSCPVGRTDDNYMQIDQAISGAINAHFAKKEVVA